MNLHSVEGQRLPDASPGPVGVSLSSLLAVDILDNGKLRTGFVEVVMLICLGFKLIDSTGPIESEGSKPLQSFLAVKKDDESFLIKSEPRRPLKVFENMLGSFTNLEIHSMVKLFDGDIVESLRHATHDHFRPALRTEARALVGD
ncbi:hypothetical protein KCU85_g110, partial [Aureobasidium melanogenum]